MRTSNRTPHSLLLIPHSFLVRIVSGNWRLILSVIVVGVVGFLTVRTAPVLAIRPAGAETWLVSRGRAPAEDSALAAIFAHHTANPERLITSLQGATSPRERLVVMTALEQMGDPAVPALITGLTSPDPGLRVAASQVLGWNRTADAVAQLIDATFDSQSMVREAAATALGEIGSLQALPRIQQLKVTEGNYYVQQAAYVAEQQIDSDIASELGIGTSELHAAAVAGFGESAYAVTSHGVYGKKAGQWSPLVNLPFDVADVVATDTTGQLVFVSGAQGLYRSADAGATWEQLVANSSVRATALTINPHNNGNVFAALAGVSINAPSAGIYASEDGGNTWYPLPYAPNDYVTNSLSLDPYSGKYLYGVTGIGAWRYVLPANVASSGAS